MIKKIISIFCLSFILFVGNTYCENSNQEKQENTIWQNPKIQKSFTNKISTDIKNFFKTPRETKKFVPLEAKIGFSLIKALSYVSNIIDITLIRFMTGFILIMFIFWLGCEAYNIIKINETNIQGRIFDIAKFILLISIWMILLNQGIANIFMFIISPIIKIGIFFSDFIINSITGIISNIHINTCESIQSFVKESNYNSNILSSDNIANLLCLPTRISSVFYLGIEKGIKLFILGIGTSALTSLIGIILIIFFIYNTINIMLPVFNVIIDLFLNILILPFTAISETFGKYPIKLKGIIADIFNNFIGIFKTESLSGQVNRFIQSSLYFISLSIIIGLCLAVCSTIITIDANGLYSFRNTNFIDIILVACFTTYLISKKDYLMQNFGGNISNEYGNKIKKDIKNTFKNTKKFAINIINQFKKK